MYPDVWADPKAFYDLHYRGMSPELGDLLLGSFQGSGYSTVPATMYESSILETQNPKSPSQTKLQQA